MSNDYRSEHSTYYLRLFFAEIMPGHAGAASARRKRESEASLELTAKALAFYLGSKPSPEELAGLKRTPEGKPYFPDYPDFHYNISHSGRYAGRGLAVPFGSYDPDLEHGRIIVPGSNRQVYLTECEAPAGYCLSVCSYVPLAKTCRH